MINHGRTKHLEVKQIIKIISAGGIRGGDTVLEQSQLLKPELTKAEAYRRYGRSDIDRWLKEGLIKIAEKRISRIKLEAVAKTSNRTTYLTVSERKERH